MPNSSMKPSLKRLHVCYFCGLSERSLLNMFSFNENVPLFLLLLFDWFLSCTFLLLSIIVCHPIVKYLAVLLVAMELVRCNEKLCKSVTLVVSLQMGMFPS